MNSALLFPFVVLLFVINWNLSAVVTRLTRIGDILCQIRDEIGKK